MQAVLIEEGMVRKPDTVPASPPVDLLADEFIRTGRHGFPVLNPDASLHGIVSLEDYRRAAEGEEGPHPGLTVGDIDTKALISVYPDDSVGAALRRMAPQDLSRLVVISRENPRELLGFDAVVDTIKYGCWWNSPTPGLKIG